MSQELLDKIKQQEHLLNWARREVSILSKAVVDAETFLIETKLKYEAFQEELRVFNNTSSIQPISLYEKEIETFRKNNPEICLFAKERDINKGVK